jgi:hypothetical protein
VAGVIAQSKLGTILSITAIRISSARGLSIRHNIKKENDIIIIAAIPIKASGLINFPSSCFLSINCYSK